MSENSLTLERVFEEVGWTAKWEAKGRLEGKEEGEAEGEAKKALQIAQVLLGKGWTPEEVAETTELDLDTLKSLTHG